jgi:hypothetical protein
MAGGTTSSREPYLKSKNAAYLWTFISINVAIFLWLFLSKDVTEASLDQFWHRVTMKDGIIAAGVPLLAIVISGILGDIGKARIVFWRWRNPLPGCRAFSELLARDPRIDAKALKAKIGKFPTDPKAQNSLWFKLFRKHSDAPRVLEAHRLYLLTRDMTAVAAFFAITMSIAMFVGTSGIRLPAISTGILVSQYVLISMAARNYAERFVLNVLSEELVA